jgi:lipopolysaccharide biosynthesis protein
MLPASPKARLIAFYLPQFHPIPANDEWWGKGFTEWTNVAKARPLFAGHYQPHLPADLGFYDLRLPEARQAQADLAREYGIHGFCYYHYWFRGKRLLERPFTEVLASGKPDFPFCLCWANENWTRRWDGHDEEILVAQDYGEEDDKEHMRWLVDAFRDERYIRVGGKPLFLVYRANELPDPARTACVWREEARKRGIGEIFLCRVESFTGERDDPAKIGFDASVEFQPDWCHFGPARCRGQCDVYDYAAVAERMLEKVIPRYTRFPCVMPSWDNAARRRSGATIIHGSTPQLYQKWLTRVLRTARHGKGTDGIVFVNAWNEWAEGNHLEPCQRWGRAYLEATREALAAVRQDCSDRIHAVTNDRMNAVTTILPPSAPYDSLIRAARADTVEILQAAREELAAAGAELEASLTELKRLERLRLATQELEAAIPPESPFILVAEDGSPTLVPRDRLVPMLLESDGKYSGPPADDETAIREVEQLRQQGARFLVVTWPAFWWLDCYSGMQQHLRSRCQCLLENERLVLFDLRQSVASVRRGNHG